MAERSWMPMYWGDYLADTLDLGPEEHGAYLLMLGIAWRRQDGALPNDMRLLKRMLSGCCSDMHGNRFNRIVPPILKRFWTLDPDDKWRQKRLGIEREKAEKISRKCSESAQKRWTESKNANDLDDAKGMHRARATLHLHKKDSESVPSSESNIPPSPTDDKNHPTESPPRGVARAKPNSKLNGHDRGSRMPEDWRPSEDAVQFCRDNFDGCTDVLLNKQFPLLKEWALTATGPNSRKRNWDRYFINWMRRACNELQEREARERRWAEQRRAH